ncbi:endonuclease/exonuclease/phosphatase family protein [Allorhizobium borbori]|uniref:Endonuclease/exonuclease/phosphatase (EEP) superfamily protein YafD n=1 Tax=Allorhizobium borbori TaxID=485907 RepID=A0A7W6K667_9HYPH|nr:endonuclease/exonuclease/phosphatase family protein [Allorhizobium borbori]MBB4104732.1 endonuclease/exonuclease/phosphatase (EEP) superfamily protein YafD [Allorhizobium borbori]
MRHSFSCISCTLAAVLIGVLATRYVHVLSYFSPFYSAQTHMALLAAALAGSSLLFRRNLPAVVLLLVALAMAVHIPARLYALSDLATASQGTGKTSLRIMSFNILGDNFTGGPAIRDEITRSGADVVVILEAEPLQSQLKSLEATYPYRLGCGEGTATCDLMVISRHPFVEKSIGTLSELRAERYMQVAVEIDGKKVNVVASHLSKPYFDHFHTAELWRLWRKLGRIEGPLVLAGDFNASSMAPDMMWFLNNTGLRRAPLEPSTWPIRLGPMGIAIDHIYARAPMRLTSLNRIGDSHGSNHYGLMADLILD